MIWAGFRHVEGHGLGGRIQIRAAAILSAWAPDDRVVFRAYDASGIAGATWQGGGQAAQTAIFPARINLPSDDPCWLKIIFRDRPGNMTTPFLLPIPPHPPLAGNLPVAEDWNE